MGLRAHWVRRAAIAAAVLAVTGCSSPLDPTTPTSGPHAGRDPGGRAVLVRDAERLDAAPRVELRSRVTRVAGHLSGVRRERVARQARATVRDYLDGAFAAAEDGPFSRFQAGLRPAARADEKVLAERSGRAATENQAVTRAAAWFSVAAPEGRPVGITARLWLESPSGTLTGRLMLTREDGRWQVFGYDLARSTSGDAR